MASLIRAKPQTDNDRHEILTGQGIQIGYTHHDIIFLIGISALTDLKKIPQILFGRLQLYNCDGSFGRSSGKTCTLIDSSGCDGCEKGAVSVFISGGNDRERVIRAECLVNLLLCILCPVESTERIPGDSISVSVRLVPDAKKPCGAVLVAENRVLIVDSGVNKADESAAASV